MTQSGGYCTSCGTAYAAGQASCGNCGRPVASPPSRGTNWTIERDQGEPPPPPDPADTDAPFRRIVSQVFGWGFGGLLVVVVAIVVVIYFASSH